jgi:hypothetical protein
MTEDITTTQQVSDDHGHEYATLPSIPTVIKGIRIVGEHALKREFTSPCLIDWLIEIPQQAHLLIRDGEIPLPLGAAEGVDDPDLLAKLCAQCADEIEGETRVMHAMNETTLSPAMIEFLIKAITLSQTFYQLLPESVKEKIRKFLPFL